MVRSLEEKDRKVTLEFLSKEPSINLFIIGDVEAFGFNSDFQELWGQFDSNGELEGVLLRFRESYIPYFTKSDFDVTEFSEIISKEKGKIILSGKKSVIDCFPKVLPNYVRNETFFCELNNKQAISNFKVDKEIRIATSKEGQQIVNLISQISEFAGSINTLEAIQHKIDTKTGRVYYIEEDNQMVSVAQTTAENSKSAMVVGVATLLDYRNKGYVSKCMVKLCSDILDEGKSLCLFYDNPKAGKIYHNIGFKNIDKWVMVKEK